MATRRHPSANKLNMNKRTFVPNMEYIANAVPATEHYTFEVDNMPAPGGAAVVGSFSPGPFGNNVVPDANNCAVHGVDYLGQPMTEQLTASTAGLKAFYRIDAITDGAALTWGDEYGLPYAAEADLSDADGTVTPEDSTDPPTAVTGDVRGTVVYAVEPDGATLKAITYQVGEPYHGLPQFYDPTVVGA